MSVIDATIEVEAPLRAAYDQWTQFEEFPRFMEAIESVEQLDATRLHWTARIAGVQREWDARITEQIPDQLVAWVSTDGARNDGVVTFEPLGATRTAVSLRLDVEPDGALETVGDALGVIQHRARRDLERFKDHLEANLAPSGAWRGEVDAGEVIDLDGAPEPEVLPGEVAASTGGFVDLDRVIGKIPVVLVFLDAVTARGSAELLDGLGDRLVDFGRERIQLLAVARTNLTEAAEADRASSGNVRILVDENGALAARFGIEYHPGHPTTLLIGADGQVSASWLDAVSSNFADDLMERLQHMPAT